jgi:hypothetical protein
MTAKDGRALPDAMPPLWRDLARVVAEANRRARASRMNDAKRSTVPSSVGPDRPCDSQRQMLQ